MHLENICLHNGSRKSCTYCPSMQGDPGVHGEAGQPGKDGIPVSHLLHMYSARYSLICAHACLIAECLCMMQLIFPRRPNLASVCIYIST